MHSTRYGRQRQQCAQSSPALCAEAQGVGARNGFRCGAAFHKVQKIEASAGLWEFVLGPAICAPRPKVHNLLSTTNQKCTNKLQNHNHHPEFLPYRFSQSDPQREKGDRHHAHTDIVHCPNSPRHANVRGLFKPLGDCLRSLSCKGRKAVVSRTHTLTTRTLTT